MEIFLFGIPVFGIALLLDFFSLLVYGHKFTYKFFRIGYELLWMLIFPAGYISLSTTNDCCDGGILGSAVFSPDHRLSILCLIIPSVAAFFYSGLRARLAPPLLELLVNAFLVSGIVLNIVLCFHISDGLLSVLGNIPIILILIMALKKNHQLFTQHISNEDLAYQNSVAWKILTAKPFVKYPVLLLLCLPSIVLMAAVLTLFGQKPDSMIRAFTETYHHGFSQWDYKCDNVECGGHYLCSVAAKGHPSVVKPTRFGHRAGGLIVCNRQLLVSNAFEELIQEGFPFLHKKIRKNYNRVGDLVHKYYYIFNNKFVCDFVYISMKPLEWIFLIVLYTFDRKPENRIARQYTSGGKKLA